MTHQQQQQSQSGPLQVQQGHQNLIHPPPPGTPKQRLLEKDLPAYRPSPDYETVMKRRMERVAQQHQQNLERLNNATNLANIARAQVYNQPETMAYSQPEMGGNFIQPQSVYVNGFVEINGMNIPNLTYRPVDRTNSLIIQPTYSTPELSSQGPSQMSTSENMITEALINQYRPPPPYRGNSNSTPDLAASQTPRSNLSNSPDLVSRRNINLSNAQLVDQSQLDQSVENLALEVHNLQLSQQMASNPRLTDESSRSSGHSGSFHKDFVYRTRSDPMQPPVLNADQMLMAQNHANPQLAVFPGGQMDSNNQQVMLHSHHQHVQPTGITTSNVQPQQVVTTVTMNNNQQQILQQPQTTNIQAQLLQQSHANNVQQQLLQQTQTQSGAGLTSAMVHHQVQQQTQQQNQQQQLQQQQQELLLQYQLQVQQHQQQLENQLMQQNLLHQTKPPPDYNEHMAQQQRQQQQQQQQQLQQMQEQQQQQQLQQQMQEQQHQQLQQMQEQQQQQQLQHQHHLQHSMPIPQSTPQQPHIQSTIQTPQTTAKQQHIQHTMQTPQFTPQQQKITETPTRHSFSLQQASLDLHDTPLLQKLQQEQPQITVTHDPDYVNLMSVSLGIDNPNYNPNPGSTTGSIPSSGPSLSALVPPAVSPSGSMQEENHYDTIDCLDNSKLPAGSSPSSMSGGGDTSSMISHSKNSSLVSHSKSSSLDTSYLSYTSSMTEEVSTQLLRFT